MLSKNTLIMAATILVSVVIGFFLGKIKTADDGGVTPDSDAVTASADAGQAQQAGGQAANQSGGQGGEQAKGMSATELAKLKSVPETIDSPQGDFTLVTVIEGEEQNRFLRSSLQAVNNQRRNLAMLTQRFNQMDPKLAQQRELLAGELNQTRQALEQNLRFMAQNFGYTLANNYLLVPHNATLR